ncbi:MAG TPA: cytochrome c biogenesis protein ResB [Desulfurivibrio alkaliphilus]|uniref:Cytochrome c biogenesis protein ResB n=1 Tax=Desulfurivibrio alkaliphilus TaxID=427923 RepID=A0A7C2TIB6_9BACT|nr:cytochrome c biogenesis protein ResB [Desulfurivibrio alkaliphilus]
MTKERNQVWRLFASVKLALWLITLLAASSILGTIIPQHKAPEYYIQEYGSELARLFQVMDIVPNMYGSWWFVALLVLFSINLIVCSLDRLPNTWRMVVLDNLETTPERLQKMPLKAEMQINEEPAAAGERVRRLLAAAGWKTAARDKEGGVLLFSQKGAWSRLGAYIIHISILIIFIGALTGSVFGYKASIMFPEGETVEHLFDRKTGQPIPLGFRLHCENFTIGYYPNNMVRDYRSDVIIIDPEMFAEPLRTSIRVNHPLKHRGLTFYQSSYQPLNEFLIKVQNTKTGLERTAMVSPRHQVTWEEEGVVFGVTDTMADRMGRVHEFRIWFDSPGADPSTFGMKDKQNVTVQRPEADYSFYVQQRYATGLQVAKDPGVWIVYLGCGLMILGLYVAFMITHRRVWAYLSPADNGGSKLLLCGGSNRNKASFDQRFKELAQRLRQDQAIN